MGITLRADFDGLGHGFFRPGGPIAAEDRNLLIITVLLMLIVVVPVFVFTPWLAWRYRRGRTDADYRPNWDSSGRLEYLVWGVPAMIVIALGILAGIQTHQLDPYRSIPAPEPPLEIQVIGLDWKWLFIYPAEGIATVNELVIPAERPVHLSLTSDTVMLSLLVPRLAGQIYVMAGMRTELNLLADHPGRFLGENTQFNGNGFQDQKFPVEAMTSEEFAAWVARVGANGQSLDRARYARLAEPSIPATSERFATVEPDLFYQVIGRYCQGCAERLRRKDRGLDPNHDGKANLDG
jgi:cytochrome o ubiquinol oxidase subunit 2